jgi:hypothetical protein
VVLSFDDEFRYRSVFDAIQAKIRQGLSQHSSGQYSYTFGGLNTPTNVAVDELDDVYVLDSSGFSIACFLEDGTVAPRAPLAYQTGSIALCGTQIVTSIAPPMQLLGLPPVANVYGTDADTIVSGRPDGTLALFLGPHMNAYPIGTAAAVACLPML